MLAVGIFIFILLFVRVLRTTPEEQITDTQNEITIDEENTGHPTTPLEEFITPPLSRAGERVTKKPFGMYITPTTSPVSPERFRGYHNGVDFEVFEEELHIDVPVYSICSGEILRKQYISGYGGVLVQTCSINEENWYILYGHLDLANTSVTVGDHVQMGDQMSILGNPYSTETDGERKHLHLGIYTGNEIDFRGYVSTQSELNAWIDIMTYLK